MSYGTPCPWLHFTSKLSLMFGWFVPLSTRLEIQFAWRAAVAKHPWLPKESGIQELQKAKTQSYTQLVIHWSLCNAFLCEIVVLACSWVIHCSFRCVFHLPPHPLRGKFLPTEKGNESCICMSNFPKTKQLNAIETSLPVSGRKAWWQWSAC